MPNVRCSAVFFWCTALAAGNLDPPSFGGGRTAPARVGVGAGGRLPGGAHAHAKRRAWQPHSTAAASSCASEPWIINTSDLTVTAEYLGLLRSCPGSVSGAETKAPTARLLVNSTFRITPGGGGAPRPAPRAPRPGRALTAEPVSARRAGSNTELCVQSDASLAAGAVNVTGVRRSYSGSRT